MSLSGTGGNVDSISTQLSNIDDLTTAVSRRLATQLMSVTYAVANMKNVLDGVNVLVDKLLPAFQINATTNDIEGIVLSTSSSTFKFVIAGDALEVQKMMPGGSFEPVGRFM
jgi:hypothetical protein